MDSLKDVVLTLLFFLPIFIGWVILFKLSAHRRDGGGFGATFLTSGFRVLRPDLYTDEGQHLLRWTWGILLVLIPWFLVFALFIG
jgi:hypothetical protein